MVTCAAILCGFILDLIFGEPSFIVHPVILMGKAISTLERCLRAVFHKTRAGEHAAGLVLAIILPCISFYIATLILWGCALVHPALRFAVESFMCFQIFATKALKTESMAVYSCLANRDLDAARVAVARIVGRDTASLTAEGIAKATVETVAENASDGVIAPLIFMAIGGAPLGFFYKAINTMDSMVGYKNEKYINFGMAAARLDDIANFIPARIAGVAMVATSFVLNMNGKNAWRIFRRDRYNHASPNSAQTESVMAGALNVQLAGDAVYFGKNVHKKTIGDANRAIEPDDIKRACSIMVTTGGICVAACVISFIV